MPAWLGRLLDLAFWYAAGLIVLLLTTLARSEAEQGAEGTTGRPIRSHLWAGILLLGPALLLLLLGLAALLWLASRLAWLSIDAGQFFARTLVPLSFVLGLYSHVALAWLSLLARVRPREVPRRVGYWILRAGVAGDPRGVGLAPSCMENDKRFRKRRVL
jgi:hypothetical protein